MSKILLTEQEQLNTLVVIDRLVSLKEEAERQYCCNTDKRYVKQGGVTLEVCDGECGKCKKEHYKEYLHKLANATGLSRSKWITDENNYQWAVDNGHLRRKDWR